MKKLVMLLMAAVLVCTLACGCSKSGGNATGGGSEIAETKGPTDEEIKESIVGAWMSTEEGDIKLGYIFNEDGTGRAALFPMTYTVKDGIITVTVEAFGKTQTGSGAYNVEGDTLKITNADGEEYTLKRTEMPEK